MYPGHASCFWKGCLKRGTTCRGGRSGRPPPEGGQALKKTNTFTNIAMLVLFAAMAVYLGVYLFRSTQQSYSTAPAVLVTVSEGGQAKLLHMPQEARSRLQSTLERIINEGCDGLICILL